MSKRKNKRTAIDPLDDFLREALQSLTLKRANQIFKSAKFGKYFDDGKVYHAFVKKVEKDLPDAEGNIDEGFQFLMK